MQVPFILTLGSFHIHNRCTSQHEPGQPQHPHDGVDSSIALAAPKASSSWRVPAASVEDGFWQQPLSAEVPSCRSLSRSKQRKEKERDISVLKGFCCFKITPDSASLELIQWGPIDTLSLAPRTRSQHAHAVILHHSIDKPSQELETKRRSPRVTVLPLRLFPCPPDG